MKTTPRHIVIKPMKTRENEKTLNAARERQYIAAGKQWCKWCWLLMRDNRPRRQGIDIFQCSGGVDGQTLPTQNFVPNKILIQMNRNKENSSSVNLHYKKCQRNISGWVEMIPNRNSDHQEGIKNTRNGKYMDKYKQVSLFLNFFEVYISN